MTAPATIINQPLPVKVKLECTQCGASGEGSCNCGAEYVAPGQRAAKALKANPERSDRAIAAEIGVDHKTVGAARKAATGEGSPVECRTGLDGKTRRLPQRSEPEPIIRQVPRSEIDWIKYAQDNVLETMKALRQSLSNDEWNGFIDWMRERTWRRKGAKDHAPADNPGNIQRDAMSDAALNRRIGKDGDSYPVKAKSCRRDVDDEDDENPEFTDADSYRIAILARVDSALTMARTATWAAQNDPADVTKAVAKELAQAVRNAAKAWCALAELLEQSSSAESDVQLDRDSDPSDQAAAFAQRRVVVYRHCFRHGTCHLLPQTEDYEAPEWVQWRAEHPDDWQYRYREVDAQGYLMKGPDGRCIRPGPWLNPDGTKHRFIDGNSPEGRRIFAAAVAEQNAKTAGPA
jgi:hypothetical protein